MPEPSGSFVFKITANGSEFLAEFKKATDGAKRSTKEIEGAVGGLGQKISGFGRELAGALGVGFGAGAAIAALSAITDKTIEGERAVSRLNAALRSTGNAAGVTQRGLNSINKELQDKSIFDDDAINQATAALLRFRSVTGETFEQALRFAPDVATALGVDLPRAAELLGRAIDQPEREMRALKDAGLNLTQQQIDLAARMRESGNVAGAAKILFAELTRAIGGSAEADATGLYGATKRSARAWDDFLKALGHNLIGDTSAIDFRTSALQRMAAVIEKLPKLSLSNLEFNPFVARQKFLDAINQTDPARTSKGLIRGDVPLSADAAAAGDSAREARISAATERAYIDQQRAAHNAVKQSQIDASAELITRKALIDEQTSAVEYGYKQQTVAASDYYEKLRQLNTQQIDAQRRDIDTRARSIEKLANQPSVGKDERSGLMQEMQALANQSNELGVQAAHKRADISRAEAAAIRSLKDAYDDLHVSLLEALNSPDAAAAKFDSANRERMRGIEAEKQSGDAQARSRAEAADADLSRLRQITIAQDAYAKAQQETGRVLSDLDVQQRQIQILRDSGTTSELQSLRQISEANKAMIPILQQRLDAETAALQGLSGEAKDNALRAIDQLNLKLLELQTTGDQVAKTFNKDLAGSLSDALTDLTTGTKKFSDVLRDFGKSIVGKINRRFADEISDALTKPGGLLSGFGDFFSKGIGDGKSGGGLANSLFGNSPVGQLFGTSNSSGAGSSGWTNGFDLAGGGGLAGASTTLSTAGISLDTAGTTLITAGGTLTGAGGALTAAAGALTAAASASAIGSSVGSLAGGGDFGAFLDSGVGSAFGLPFFAEGSSYIQRSGMAVVHEGEAIIPKRFNGRGGVGPSHFSIVNNWPAGTSSQTIDQASAKLSRDIRRTQRRRNAFA